MTTINKDNYLLFLFENSYKWNKLTSDSGIEYLNVIFDTKKSNCEDFLKTLLKKFEHITVKKAVNIIIYFNLTLKLNKFIYLQSHMLKKLNIRLNLSKENASQDCFIWKTIGFFKNLKSLRILISKPNESQKKIFKLKTKSSLEILFIYFKSTENKIQFLFSQIESSNYILSFPNDFFRSTVRSIRQAILSKIMRNKKHSLKRELEQLLKTNARNKKIKGHVSYVNYLRLLCSDSSYSN